MKALEIVIVPVKDQKIAKEFYLKLGFQMLVEAPADHGQTWIQMALPGDKASIAIMAFHGIIFETDNIEKDILEYKSKGIEFGKVDNQPLGKFAWTKDPDENGLCLHQH